MTATGNCWMRLRRVRRPASRDRARVERAGARLSSTASTRRSGARLESSSTSAQPPKRGLPIALRCRRRGRRLRRAREPWRRHRDLRQRTGRWLANSRHRRPPQRARCTWTDDHDQLRRSRHVEHSRASLESRRAHDAPHHRSCHRRARARTPGALSASRPPTAPMPTSRPPRRSCARPAPRLGWPATTCPLAWLPGTGPSRRLAVGRRAS